MTIEQFMGFQNRMVRAAEDGTGGGAGGEGGEGGDGGTGGEGGEAGTGGEGGGEGGEGGTAGEGGEGEGGGAKWWESNKLSDIQRSTITAAGLTVDDPVEAVAKLADMEAAAQRKLGAKPEELMRRPKEGQDVAEWLRENGDVFGIPEAPEKYEVKPPESWPKDAKWDEGLETEARKIAHEEGLSGRALQRLTDLYAGKVAQLSGDLEADQAAAVTEMNEALQKEWGDQFNAKTVQARQAMSVVMERAGIDPEGMQNVLNLLSSKGGDPETMRVFAAIGEMMGDDMLVGNGDGESTIGETPASARAKIEAMKKDGSPYREAQKQANKTGDKSEFNRLHKQYLALQKIAAR